MSTSASHVPQTQDEMTSPAQLTNRGIMLRREFECRARREDLDRAIEYHNQAVSLTSIDHEDYPTWLDELGVSLQVRFKHFGDLSDITSAVERHEQAVALTLDAHSEQPKRIKNLGNSLQIRFERLGDRSDLHRGISCLNQAIKLAHHRGVEFAPQPGLDDLSESVDFLPVKITNSMSTDEILTHLVDHGCPDLTEDLETLGEYPVANGGLGLIFRATLKDGSHAAVKILACLKGLAHDQKGLLKQAAHELHVWSKCTHPYVQELLGVARVREQIAMISRWLEHGDLPEYLQNYPTTDRCKMCTRVAEGLTYLHGRGIVHGDIKGGNILVADDHAPKLTDFGNATLQDYSLRFATTTTKRHISWRWTAPELYDEGKESKEADVYALGMEIIMGRMPFHGWKESKIMRFVTLGKIHERPEEFIPTRSLQGNLLWSILLKCWAFEIDERPTAAEVWNELSVITPEGLLQITST